MAIPKILLRAVELSKRGMFEKGQMLKSVSRSGKTVVEVTRDAEAPAIIEMVRKHPNGSQNLYRYSMAKDCVTVPFVSVIENPRGRVQTETAYRQLCDGIIRRQWIKAKDIGTFYADTNLRNPLLSTLRPLGSNRIDIYDEKVTQKLLDYIFGRKKAPTAEQLKNIFTA